MRGLMSFLGELWGLIRKHTNLLSKEEKELAEIERVSLAVGLALIACCHTEKEFQRLLGMEEQGWLDRPYFKQSLGAAVRKLIVRLNLDKNLAQVFSEFVERRNRLVHAIFDISKGRLATSESRQEVIHFASETRRLARELAQFIRPSLDQAFEKRVGTTFYNAIRG